MKKTMDEIIFSSVIPNVSLLEKGEEFIVEDLVPPIFWRIYTDHKGIGMVFSKISEMYQLPIEYIPGSSPKKYRKI